MSLKYEQTNSCADGFADKELGHWGEDFSGIDAFDRQESARPSALCY